MCGRYVVSDERDMIEIKEIIDEVNSKYYGNAQQEKMKGGEIFPTDTVPVILPAADKTRSVELLRWGFPSFTGKGVIINARSETAHEKSLFKRPLQQYRCIVPSVGFFEWDHTPGQPKTKYLFYRDRPLYMAGIYNQFRLPETGEEYRAFAILTTDANPSVADIHNRMPVLLAKEHLEDWLFDPQQAMQLLALPMPLLERRLA